MWEKDKVHCGIETHVGLGRTKDGSIHSDLVAHRRLVPRNSRGYGPLVDRKGFLTAHLPGEDKT
jgi:hypothetical protein